MQKWLIFFILLIPIISLSQIDRCGTDEYRQYLKKNNLYEGVKFLNKSNNIRSNYTIPVVVHVLYNNEEQNISNEKIWSQIDVLNQDYNLLNNNLSLVPDQFIEILGDVGFDFCLVQYDLEGGVSNGINRVYTEVESFQGFNDDMKNSSSGGVDAWDTNQYLNLWVCNLSGNLLGFATMPGDVENIYDGVVIDYNYFGVNLTATNPYNLGKTVTHEVGHYFNLEHVFYAGCSDWDNCDDTPSVSTATYGCPESPQESCGGEVSMTMNYMDYTDDACMCMFTTCQAEIMVSTLLNQRFGLLGNDACSIGLDGDVFELEKIYPNPFQSSLNINISNSHVLIFDLFGRIVMRQHVISPTVLNLDKINSGLYILYIPEQGYYKEILKI
jgi:hypothetical protein